ncbi:hypothetical protein F4604DRAFT_1686940 [Suillus subluteus]|nr:hypothetical protein F4604DRAFT_1686940 [Suillus subluteus]
MSMCTVKKRVAEFSDFFPSRTMSRFTFIGYAAHDYQLAPIYWPEEYYSLTHSSCNIVRQIGFLTFEHERTKYSLYEIEPESSGFLEDIRAPFCGANLEGTLCPIWVLDRLKGIPFNPAQFPNGFPPPAPIPIDFPMETPWNALNSFSQQSITFPEMLLPLSLDFDNNPTIDLTVASTLDDMFVPALDDSNLMNTTNFTYHQPIDEVQVPHMELHWREILKDNLLDSSQKKSLKVVLMTSPWGRPIRLAKYLYVGRLITASFLRALHLDLKTYEGLREEPLMVVNNAGSDTCLGWSDLRNRFLETPVDFTSEMRKVIRGGTTPESGFGDNAEQQAQLKLRIIDLLNSGDQIMIQQAITDLIVTQGFRELLWASFFRPVVDFANGQARLADLYPEAIQTLTGYLGKGVVGVLVTLMYQTFTPHTTRDSYKLKTLQVYPQIIAALDDMYAYPHRFDVFFQAARQLPCLREQNVLSIDPKSQNPRTIIDPLTDEKRMKTLLDIHDIVVVPPPDELAVPYARFTLPHSFKAVDIHHSAALREQNRRSRSVSISFETAVVVSLVLKSGRISTLDASVESNRDLFRSTLRKCKVQQHLGKFASCSGYASQQQLAALSDRGVGIWPTQLPRYAEVVLLTDDAYEDSTVRAKEISDPLPLVYGDWQELVHPLGGTYFYNSRKNTYTSTNLRTYQGLQTLDKFVDVSCAAAKEDSWLLVVQPTIFMGREVFQYYYVVPGSRIITWLEDLNGYILFRECVKTSEWRHKRLELEAQYWKHFEFFPHDLKMDRSEVRSIRREMVCYLGEATTLKQSTAASMFWSSDDMNHVVNQLAYVGRILYVLLREREDKYKLLSFIGNATATMLCMPITIERIRSTSIDGIINGVEVQSFIDDFGNQTRNQITLAGISVALDIAILAIPGLGATPTAQTLCSCSFLLGIGCIFAGTIAHHFGE